jgi:hypothetical protein
LPQNVVSQAFVDDVKEATEMAKRKGDPKLNTTAVELSSLNNADVVPTFLLVRLGHE